MFEPLPAQFNFPQAEERVLEFWEQHKIFARSLEQRRGAPRFVFYEGPPTANGLPHPGHCLTRAIKDLFPRYQTMCGKLVERKAGWDTHGLPVEVEVCKELGIHTKEEIEAYGVEKFIRKCIESVFRYTREWEQMTRRLGFWVNLEEAYVTFHQSYVESVWWSLKTLFDRGLLYQGHKVVWWWAQGGTALSAGEVGEGYRTVQDPSVYVRFPLVAAGASPAVEATKRRSDEATKGATAVSAVREDETPAEPRHLRLPADAKVSLLVWTTTPWTLISNHFAAVGADMDYSLVQDETTDEYFYIATALVGVTAEKVKHKLVEIAPCKGSALIGLRYEPPFDCYSDQTCYPATDVTGQRLTHGSGGRTRGDSSLGNKATLTHGGVHSQVPMKELALPLRDDPTVTLPVAWRVLQADFVDLATGTGIVHIAPAYGEVDFMLLQDERRRFAGFEAIPLINAVKPDGTFSDEAPQQYRGRWVKDCDKEIMRELKDRGILYHQETIEHEYPFCPRAEDDPLIQYARKSWFVRTSQFKEEFLKNNAAIQWLPEHIQEGRFGDFLRNNVDWALSRERWWGTPLPIWVCEKTGKMEAIGSYAELLAKPGVQGVEVWEAAKKADPTLPDHLKVHKPYIDEVTYDSPFVDEPGARATGHSASATDPSLALGARTGTKPRMRRVPEVIDCWWDAGSMPFAQWGFPHAKESIRTFVERFPADFISEAIDQTRGWFYGLLAISTLLFGDHRAAQETGVPKNAVPTLPPYPSDSKLIAWLRRVGVLPQVDDPKIVEKLRGWLLPAGGGGQSADPKPDPVTAYPMPYRTCIVLGHVMGEDGLKMSKRTKNYKEPAYIFDTYGADAMRWYFFSAQAPWTSVRFQEANIRGAQREFLVRLYNVFSFFNIYANIDGFEARHEGTEARRHEGSGGTEGQAQRTATKRRSDEGQSKIQNPKSKMVATGWRPVAERAEIDRWITSELHRAIRDVRAALDRLENYPAAGRLNEFVDALSNWYVRRSRDRFWRPLHATSSQEPRDSSRAGTPRGVNAAAPADQDKWDAYNTLYEVLLTLSQLIAPFTPFFAETMYQNLTGTEGRRGEGTKGQRGSEPFPPSHVPTFPRLSVHLCEYPVADNELIDDALGQEMDLVREIVSLGRAARTSAKLKVRQPLALAEIILARREHTEWLASHSALIAEELNLKQVDFSSEAEQYVTYALKPDFKAIGPKFGKLAPQVAAALNKMDAAAARKELETSGRLVVTVNGESVILTDQEVAVRLEARPGWSAAQGRGGVVVVKTELTDELRDEGLCRELIHQVQTLRKEQDLPYQARVTLYVDGPDKLRGVVGRYSDTIKAECLAASIELGATPADIQLQAAKIEGHAVRLGIVRV